MPDAPRPTSRDPRPEDQARAPEEVPESPLTWRDAPGPSATIRDGVADSIGETIRDVDAGVRGGDDGWGHGRLPQPLADRFEVRRELPVHGGEADIKLVRDREGTEFVLKLYRRGFDPDPKVWAAVRGMRSRHIVRIFETGRAGDRSYELMEHLTGGTLDEVDRGQLEEVVRQLAELLAELHALGYCHRDLKPNNVLLRSGGAAGGALDLAVIDLGISRPLAYPQEPRTTRSKTWEYAPPEAVAGWASFAGDWWSLGITLVELTTERNPYAGMSPAAIGLQQVSRSVDVSGVADPRLRQLCRGLLLRDHAHRWGAEEVARWLAHQPVVLPDDLAPELVQRVPLAFLGQEHTERVSLALALTASWQVAVREYFGLDVRPRRRLKGWLRNLGDLDAEGVEVRERLLEALEGSEPPDVKLLRLVRWLAPGERAFYRGYPITFAGLLELTGRALGSDPQAAELLRLVDDLWRHHLLVELGGAAGGAGLAEVDARWRHLERNWQALAEELRGRHRELGPELDRLPEQAVVAQLLRLAVDADGAAGASPALREEAERAREEIRQRLTGPNSEVAAAVSAAVSRGIGWFDELAASTNPLRLLAAALLGGAAVRAVEAQLRRRYLDGVLAAEREKEEWQRRQGRPKAVAWALAAVGVVVVVWVAVLLWSYVVPFASTGTLTIARAFAELSIATLAVAEGTLAVMIGTAYHPRYSLLGAMIGLGAKVAEPAQKNGMLGVGMILGALLVLVLATTLVPFLLPLAVVLGHPFWAKTRYDRWQRTVDARLQERQRRVSESIAAGVEGRTDEL